MRLCLYVLLCILQVALCRDVFDYIIVGGGTAGSVLAYRLSANPLVTVALIEAGGNQTSNPFVYNTASARSQSSTSLHWNLFTDPEPRLKNKKLQVAQGRMLGGSSGANQYAYERSVPQDWNSWANAVGDQRWNYENVLPFFKRSEKNVEFRDEYHGTEGPLRVVSPSKNIGCPSFAAAWSTVAGEMNYTASDDLNGATVGFGFEQSTLTTEGTRDYVTTAFLNAAADRPNLEIFQNSLATKIIFGQGNHRDTARGVVVGTPEGQVILSARREVIISSGALRSPFLLMHSGIGPRDELERVGIRMVKDLSGVGKNLMDNYVATVTYSARNVALCPCRPAALINTEVPGSLPNLLLPRSILFPW